jgi:hypothetical protein
MISYKSLFTSYKAVENNSMKSGMLLPQAEIAKILQVSDHLAGLKM